MKRLAVIGFGNIAIRHRRNLKRLFPKAQLYAMSATGRIPKEQVSDADHILSSINELIKYDIQLAIVASPASLHLAHSLPLLEAGIPVLIEKPVAMNAEEANKIQAVADLYKTPVAVGYCLRYLPSTREMKKILASGLIGDLYHANIEIGQYLPDWRQNKDYRDSVSASISLGGGALMELSHEFDYAQWLLGDLALEHAILRRTEELDLEVEDSADMFLSTSHKAIVYIHLDFLQRKPHRQCRFVGSKGTLQWDLITNDIHFDSIDGTQTLYSEPDWDKNQMYIAMIDDFIKCIENRSNESISLYEATKSMKLIDQIKQHFPISTVPGELKVKL